MCQGLPTSSVAWRFARLSENGSVAASLVSEKKDRETKWSRLSIFETRGVRAQGGWTDLRKNGIAVACESHMGHSYGQTMMRRWEDPRHADSISSTEWNSTAKQKTKWNRDKVVLWLMNLLLLYATLIPFWFPLFLVRMLQIIESFENIIRGVKLTSNIIQNNSTWFHNRWPVSQTPHRRRNPQSSSSSSHWTFCFSLGWSSYHRFCLFQAKVDSFHLFRSSYSMFSLSLRLFSFRCTTDSICSNTFNCMLN